MTDSSDTERLGVGLASVAFTKWGWVFRDQPIGDYGIDAHVEPKTNGVPSGRPVALQIKTGQSYFAEPTEDGWLYRGKDRHLRYWLGHTLPVLIILCDPDTETPYWQHVTTERIDYTPNGWTILIPRSQTVIPDAKDAITAIAYAAVGATEDPLDETMPFLPPSVAGDIRRVAASEPGGALRLAVALARGRHEPRLAVETILASRPSWLERGGGQFEAVLGAYAVEHGHPDLAARAFTLAAEQVDAGAGRLYALAAVFTAGTGDLPRATELLDHAEAAGGPPVLLAAVRWHVRRLHGADQVPVPDVLEAASPHELASEPMCLQILGEDAGNRRDIRGVLSYAEQAQAIEPDNSGLQLRVAEALLWRVSDGSAAVPAEDLRRAEDLATAAWQQRRRWAGPSEQAVTVLLRKHLLVGAYTTMISLATPSPQGQASEHEADEGNVAYLGAIAALALGQRDKATEFVDRVEGTPIAAGLRALIADPDLPRDEQIRLWQEAMPTIDQHDLRLRGLYRLAALGAWPFPELDQAGESGILDPVTADLLAARSEAARGHVQAAVMRLRRHIAASAAAVELLVEVLENDGQYDQALQECARGIARFGEVVLDAMRLNLLLRSEQHDAATDSAIQLLARTDLPAERRLALRRRLIGFYTMRADWVNVETHSRAALGEHPGQADLQWALIGATINQGRLDDAWTRFQQLTPPIIHRGALGAWMGLHAQFGFTEADITTALDSLTRWPDDPEVGAQILTTLMHAGGRRTPDGRPVLPDLDAAGQQRFQDALQDYTARHPDGPIRTIAIDGLNFAEMMRAQLAPHAEQDRLLVSLVRQGRLPLGMLAASRGRPYAQALVQHACGPIVAMTLDPGRFDREIAAVRASLNQSVVVETSTLTTATLLPARWPALRAVFAELVVPRNVLHDIQITGAELRRDPDSLSWIGFDPDQDVLTLTEASQHQTSGFITRITEIDAAARDLVAVDTPARDAFPDRGGFGDREVWVSPLETAAQTGKALWSDDVVVREVAAGQGIPAFSSLALLHVLVEDELIEDTLRADVQTFARAHVVDLTLTVDELLAIARDENWSLGAAATYVQRGGFWSHYDSALTDCLPIFENVHAHEPDLLVAWLVSVCVGVADHVADIALENALGMVTDTIADHLAVDTPTRDVLHDAAGAAAETIRRQRDERLP
jgi:tetratricopeptide (TPR) repeat protein